MARFRDTRRKELAIIVNVDGRSRVIRSIAAYRKTLTEQHGSNIAAAVLAEKLGTTANF